MRCLLCRVAEAATARIQNDIVNVIMLVIFAASAPLLLYVSIFSFTATHEPVNVKVVFRQGFACAFDFDGNRQTVNHCPYNPGEHISVQKFNDGTWRMAK